MIQQFYNMLHTILFPQLLEYTNCTISKEDLYNLEYFQKAACFLSKKNINLCVSKLHSKLQTIKVKKGTLIYTHSENADVCYLMLTGKVTLLNKKTSQQKLQTYPNHTLYSTQQKITYLVENFGFQPKIAEKMIQTFYQQKVMFKYLPYRQIQGSGQFGFGQLLRNSLRPLTAIATLDSQLLVITKTVFDQCIRDFESRKESVYIQKVLDSLGKESAERLRGKIGQIMNLGTIRILDKGQVLYEENNDTRFLYFLLQGEVEMRKRVTLQIPKKFIQNENKKVGKKQAEVKVCKIGESSFIGDSEIIRHQKKRIFTIICSINQTLLLQIEPLSFQKIICEYIEIEKVFIVNSTAKLNLALENFQKQYCNLNKAFLKQYEQFQSKTRQSELLNQLNDPPQVKKQFFQIFTNEGLFYRDTFEKIEGFDFSDPPKKKSIKMTRMKDLNAVPKSPQQIKSAKKQEIKRQEKILFSPKTQLNQADFLVKSILNHQNPTRTLTKHSKSYQRFEGIKKDQQVFKRVMIKHGLYFKQRGIDRSRIAKPIINYNFDDVVKQCISRKNPVIRRVSDSQKKSSLIKQSYQNTIKTLKSQMTPRSRFSNLSTPCLGVEQMRKRMQQYKNKRQFFQTNTTEVFPQSPELQECIGVNESPKSRQVKYRSNLRNTIDKYQTPQKIVLLNHMMKPMTYNSAEVHW